MICMLPPPQGLLHRVSDHLERLRLNEINLMESVQRRSKNSVFFGVAR
jgi:hypothetical protein